MIKFLLCVATCLLGFLSCLPADPAVPAVENPAVIPAAKLENDFYNWEQRHAEILQSKAALDPAIVMLGDSITHLWGGSPNEPKGNRGQAAWKELFGDHRVLNCGFGWDRTQNVLWRIDHGELDDLKPQLIVLNIGTNNLAQTNHCRASTAEEIAAGIRAAVERCQAKCPQAKLVVMGVFPRGRTATDPNRAKVAAINVATAKVLADFKTVTFLDIGKKFIGPDGSIAPELMPDALHPSNAGYALWAGSLREFVTAVKH